MFRAKKKEFEALQLEMKEMNEKNKSKYENFDKI